MYDIDREAATILRQTRRGERVTIRELAKLAGICPGTIRNSELGYYGTKIYTIAKLLDALGYDLHIEAIRRAK